jgi:D-3-phosphoglycerate dehydrogenase
MPHLKVLARTGVGTERVDVAEATRRGIPVMITPGSNTHAVAEGALAHLLALTKALPQLTALVREDEWASGPQSPWEISRVARWRCWAMAELGARVAKLAQAFGMSVVAYDPYVSQADVPLAPPFRSSRRGNPHQHPPSWNPRNTRTHLPRDRWPRSRPGRFW